MNRFSLSIALCLCLLADAASAENVTVLGGEHNGFTRVVVPLARPSGWRFGRVDGGYGLILDRPDIVLDTSRAFDLIPRTRLLDLVLPAAGNGLTLKTDCPCHATLVEDRPGLLVIDLLDGPPPENAVFEARLDEPAPPSRAASQQMQAAALSPEEVAQLPYFWGDIAALASESRPAPLPGAQESGAVTDITRDYSQPPEAGNSATELFEITKDYSKPPEAERPDPPAAEPIAITRDYSAPADPAKPQPALAERPTQSPPAESAAALPAEVQITRDYSAPADISPATTDMPAAVPAADPGDPAPVATTLLPLLPGTKPGADAPEADPTFSLRAESPRVDAARDALLMQLSRAATQGLVDVAQPERPLMPSEIVAQQTAPRADPHPVPAPLPEASSPDDHMTIKAETSIDRDSLARVRNDAVTPDGVACLPDRKFDVAKWGDDRPMAEQLTEKRQALVGEFDAPSSEAVADMAKLYLYFGFGAEARETLRAFGVSVRDSDLLLLMAESMDNGSAVDPGRLKGMADCDTAAALWSVLATTRLTSGDPVNVPAVVRTFSALPLTLRRLIGPKLSERFLDMGNDSAARTLRDAVTRAAGDPGPETQLVNARLDLTLDRTAEAEATMQSVIAADGDAAPEALILLIDTQIKQGVTVDQKTVETAAALAFEHRGTELGSKLARAEVLSKAASNDFNGAFATLARQTRTGPKAMPTELDVDLFTLLQTRADDATFLRHMFASANRLKESELPRPIRQGLAQRMISLGFPDEARAVLAASSKPKAPDKLILARIALAQRDPGAALRQIEGMDGPEAALIEADAMTQLGYHAQAAIALERAAQTDAAASAGWRAGDVAAVEKYGTPEQQSAVKSLLAPPQEPAAPATDPAAALPGPLARNRALLADSQRTRDELAALLQAFPNPEPAAAP